VNPITDAGKMALMAALRRDWAPPPATLDWQPAMQEVLVHVAMEIEAEQLARTYTTPEDSPWTSTLSKS
jgi:hypothetical protein